MLLFNAIYFYSVPCGCDLNTSNVIVQLLSTSLALSSFSYLNTSNVIVQLTVSKIKSVISPYLNTSNVIVQRLISRYSFFFSPFKYIQCYCSTHPFIKSIMVKSYLNTSNVIVQRYRKMDNPTI